MRSRNCVKERLVHEIIIREFVINQKFRRRYEK